MGDLPQLPGALCSLQTSARLFPHPDHDPGGLRASKLHAGNASVTGHCHGMAPAALFSDFPIAPSPSPVLTLVSKGRREEYKRDHE